MTSSVRVKDDSLVHEAKAGRSATTCGIAFGPGRIGTEKAWLPRGEDAGNAEVDCMACVAGIDLERPIEFTVELDIPITYIQATFVTDKEPK